MIPEPNGQAPPQPAATVVDAECVIPYLANQLREETGKLQDRINELLYENALKAGYIDQLKKEIAELRVDAEQQVTDQKLKEEFFEQSS